MSTRTVYVSDLTEGTVIFIPIRTVWDRMVCGMRIYTNMHNQTAEIDSATFSEEVLLGYRLVTGDEAEWILEMVKKYIEGLLVTAEYHSRQPYPVLSPPEPEPAPDTREGQGPAPELKCPPDMIAICPIRSAKTEPEDREPDFDCPHDLSNAIRRAWINEDEKKKEDKELIDKIGSGAIKEALEALAEKERIRKKIKDYEEACKGYADTL